MLPVTLRSRPMERRWAVPALLLVTSVVSALFAVVTNLAAAALPSWAGRGGPWLWTAVAVLSLAATALGARVALLQPGGGPDLRPAGVPAGVGDFLGRITELSAVRDCVSRRAGGAAVAAITGQPGVGKSALAIHVAHLLKDRFRDGQLYTNLHGSGPAPLTLHDVLPRLLHQLGMTGEIPNEED